jgi:hypothetical protein
LTHPAPQARQPLVDLRCVAYQRAERDAHAVLQRIAEAALWKDEFDSIYNDNGYYILTYHPRSGFGSGIPSRARVIDRLIAYIKTFPDVHFTRMDELAMWCVDPANGFMGRETWIGGRA